jgi:hypothetical protein
MQEVGIECFPPEVRLVVEKAALQYPQFGPGVRLGIVNRREGRYARVALASNGQVSWLAAQLAQLGCKLVPEEIEGCDFVLDLWATSEPPPN